MSQNILLLYMSLYSLKADAPYRTQTNEAAVRVLMAKPETRPDRILALCTRDNRLHTFLQISLFYRAATQTYRAQRRFVDDICQIRARCTGRCARNRIEVNISRHMDILGMHLQNRFASA